MRGCPGRQSCGRVCAAPGPAVPPHVGTPCSVLQPGSTSHACPPSAVYHQEEKKRLYNLMCVRYIGMSYA